MLRRLDGRWRYFAVALDPFHDHSATVGHRSVLGFGLRWIEVTDFFHAHGHDVLERAEIGFPCAIHIEGHPRGRVPQRANAARGCEACAGTGYRGRQGIYELFVPDEALRAAIVAGTSPDVMRTRAAAMGTVSLRDEGWRLVRDGITTPEELVRAVGESDE